MMKSSDQKVPLDGETPLSSRTEEQGPLATIFPDQITDEPNDAINNNTADIGSNYSSFQNKLDVIDGGATGQFDRLVRGWETMINDRLGASSNDPRGDQDKKMENDDQVLSAPVVLRHTHSSPLNYASWFDYYDDDVPPPQPGPELMKRSNSTPMVERSPGSAFGTTLRTIPHLTGSDEGSAFSLPMQRKFQMATSDTDKEAHFSAFDPVMLSRDKNDAEKTSIEVTDMSAENGQLRNTTSSRWQRASKARNFIIDNVRVLSRRRDRSGRENPARPASLSSSSSTGNNSSFKKGQESRNNLYSASAQQKDIVGDSNPTLKVSIEVNVEDDDADTNRGGNSQASITCLGSTDEDDGGDKSVMVTEKSGKPSHYQQLCSDFDEEYCGHSAVHMAASHNSRLANAESPQPRLIGSTFSQDDSAADSPGTAMSCLTMNTSGHSTLATNTSATTNSDKLTTLSVVSETDREVMETNKAGRDFRLMKPKKHVRRDADGDATVNSSSTGSTTTHGYLSLVGSPATIRDGASMPVDQFFKGTQIPVVHSISSNSGSSNGDSSRIAEAENATGTVGTTVERVESQLTCSTIHPFGPADSSNKATASNSTQSNEPPVFVSYLQKQGSEKEVPKEGYRTSSPGLIETVHEELPQEQQSPFGTALSSNNTTSSDSTRSQEPPMFVSYLHRENSDETEKAMEVVFEAAKPESRKVFRPVRKLQRDRRISERPPLSPCKGLRMQTTPPPSGKRFESSSPIHQQQSPPNIIHHRVQNSRLSRPYVFRSALQRNRVALISPDRHLPLENKDFVQRGKASADVVGFNETYHEKSVEVDKLGVVSSPTKVVTPEKDVTPGH